ncbi:hypothetical protein LWI28_027825 [Acer negundo]|uniref:Uncharacterized protein n=1 Tax=Acer negundo TaxID=4023 RepID=A0AAD5NQZ3_ACENE|nr:hypothetical protein LWI28_027825 [Acer negundo]
MAEILLVTGFGSCIQGFAAAMDFVGGWVWFMKDSRGKGRFVELGFGTPTNLSVVTALLPFHCTTTSLYSLYYWD